MSHFAGFSQPIHLTWNFKGSHPFCNQGLTPSHLERKSTHQEILFRLGRDEILSCSQAPAFRRLKESSPRKMRGLGRATVPECRPVPESLFALPWRFKRQIDACAVDNLASWEKLPWETRRP